MLPAVCIIFCVFAALSFLLQFLVVTLHLVVKGTQQMCLFPQCHFQPRFGQFVGIREVDEPLVSSNNRYNRLGLKDRASKDK